MPPHEILFGKLRFFPRRPQRKLTKNKQVYHDSPEQATCSCVVVTFDRRTTPMVESTIEVSANKLEETDEEQRKDQEKSITPWGVLSMDLPPSPVLFHLSLSLSLNRRAALTPEMYFAKGHAAGAASQATGKQRAQPRSSARSTK